MYSQHQQSGASLCFFIVFGSGSTPLNCFFKAQPSFSSTATLVEHGHWIEMVSLFLVKSPATILKCTDIYAFHPDT